MFQIINIIGLLGILAFLFFFGMHIMKELDTYMGSRKKKDEGHPYIVVGAFRKDSPDMRSKKDEAVI